MREPNTLMSGITLFEKLKSSKLRKLILQINHPIWLQSPYLRASSSAVSNCLCSKWWRLSPSRLEKTARIQRTL